MAVASATGRSGGGGGEAIVGKPLHVLVLAQVIMLREIHDGYFHFVDFNFVLNQCLQFVRIHLVNLKINFLCQVSH